MIAEYFDEHFSKVGTSSSDTRTAQLKSNYEKLRANYAGWPDLEEHKIDAGLVESVINSMCRGKAASLDSITAEHLQYCYS